MDATRGPILFRCDGTPERGWEPFYQCLSLAAALQRRRRGTHFLSYLDPLSLATVVNRGNNDWIPAEQQVGGPGDLEATAHTIAQLSEETGTDGRELGVSDLTETLLELNDSEGLISNCLESQLALARVVRYLNGEVDSRREAELQTLIKG